jgi:hypothetical protein
MTTLLLGAYLALVTLLWLGMAAGIAGWHRRFALPELPREAPLPRLSLCVPARDEVANIGACVRAALAQDHPDVEVIVIDDGSSDGTAEEALAAAGGDPRVRVIRNDPPPAGWAGKPWACARAAREATGAQLCFVDADVRLAPDAARRAAGVLVERRLGLLSLFGSWELVSFWERAAIPAIGWFIRGATDIEKVNRPAAAEAFANGQFILVDRASYEAHGGHGLVAAEVLEDVRLARALKQRGVAIGLYAAPWAFRVRLYRSLGEILAGYGKNLYEGMDRKPGVAVAGMGFLFVVGLAPWLLLGVTLARPGLVLPGLPAPGAWLGWMALTCLLPMGFRAAVERADGRSGAIAWAHPLANLVLAAVLLRAMFGVRTTWKGRVFQDGKAA